MVSLSLSDPTAEFIKNRVLLLLLRAGQAPSPSCLVLAALLLVCCSGQMWFCAPCLARFTWLLVEL